MDFPFFPLFCFPGPGVLVFCSVWFICFSSVRGEDANHACDDHPFLVQCHWAHEDIATLSEAITAGDDNTCSFRLTPSAGADPQTTQLSEVGFASIISFVFSFVLFSGI